MPELVFELIVFGVPMAYWVSYLFHFALAKAHRNSYDKTEWKWSNIEGVLFWGALFGVIISFVEHILNNRFPYVFQRYEFHLFLARIFVFVLIFISVVFFVKRSSKLKELKKDSGLIGKTFLNFPPSSYEYVLSKKTTSIDQFQGSKPLERELKGNKLRRLNTGNFFVSLILSAIGICLFKLRLINGVILSIATGMFFIRSTARCGEILFACLTDALEEKETTTNLKPADRLLFFMLSLVEVAILFAVASFFLAPQNGIREHLFNSFNFATMLSGIPPHDLI